MCDDTEVDIGLKSGQRNGFEVFPWPSCLKFSPIAKTYLPGNFCMSVMSIIWIGFDTVGQ